MVHGPNIGTKIIQNWLVVEPTPLEKYARQNGSIFPNFRVKL